jgi:ABC-type spermidine/putrescine transport system permease subunit II
MAFGADGQGFTMIYVKSMVAGFLALVIVFIVLPIGGIIVYSFTHTQPDGTTSIGWDPISLVKQSPFLTGAVAAIVFACGFFWEFRRLTNH